MKNNNIKQWFNIKQYMHSSWLKKSVFHGLNMQSSELMWNLIYSDMCKFLGIRVMPPNTLSEKDMENFILFNEQKNNYNTIIDILLNDENENYRFKKYKILKQNSLALSFPERMNKFDSILKGKDARILNDFILYTFACMTNQNLKDRIKIQFDIQSVKYFTEMENKLSNHDLRSIFNILHHEMVC